MKKVFERMRVVAVAVFARLTDLVKKWRSKPQPAIAMLDLSPRYDQKVHKVYVDTLEEALRDKRRDEPQARNIALSGSYGVGKSSILDEVKRRHKKQTIAISLATLGFPDKVSTTEPNTTTTNVIQKEIVKQILYSEHPAKMSGSQYRRVARVQKWRTLGHAVIISFALTLVFFIVGWATLIKGLIPDIPYVGNSIYVALVICWIVLMILAFWVLCEIHNRFHIEQLSADKAGLTLSSSTATYFDEYLDEIVYFFELADKCDLVIFEDIDRFGDHEIFETLRSLNTILNTAKQLKGREIRFIYAVKDSIFEPDSSEHDDVAQAEANRANRTKFFDLIIPVVPFVTHTSARNLLEGVLKDADHKLSGGLIDLVARHIPDMRLIKNIRNEFAIFKNQILDNGNLDLSQDGLFAIVAYKNVHLKDFEQARLGKSDLDTVYKAYRDIINTCTATLNGTISGYKNELRNLSSVKNIGNAFGTKFVEDITRTMTRTSGTMTAYQYQGAIVTDQEILTDTFWNKFAEDKGSITITYRTQYSTTLSFDVTHDELVKIVSDPLDAEKWKKDERQRISKLINDAEKDTEFLKRADMLQLFARPEFRHDNKSFGEVLNESLKSELAVELVREGYIDRKFTLYTSVFNGTRVSANAMNFIIKNIDSDVVDVSFELSDNDVESIIRDRPDVLNQKAAYNINILDYLLVNASSNLGQIINQLVQGGTQEKSFINTYLESGHKRPEFIKVITEQWAAVFTHLVSPETPLSDKDRIDLVDIALRSIRSSINYDTNGALKDFIEKSYGELDVLRSTKTTSNQAVEISALFNNATIEIDDLAFLSESVKNTIVSVEAYKISRANILLALGDQNHSLSLDQIKSSSDVVYHHILDNVSSYLIALKPKEQTITDKDQFSAIILEILSASSGSLDAVIERSDSSCTVEVLANVSSDTWTILAKYKRFPVSFVNVSAYVEKIGVDEAIALMLAEAGEMSAVDGVEEAAKTTLVEKLLPIGGRIPSAELRANIVASLNLENFLDDDLVPNEDGKLIGWLIDKQIVADNAETFAHIDTSDTDGLLFAISKSTEFKNFISTAEVTAQNVDKVLHSSIVPKTVKDVIVNNFTNYTNGAARDILESTARYVADETDIALPLANVARLANEGVDTQLVIRLLRPHLTNITLANITPILTSLGGGYAELTERSHKRPKFNKDDAHDDLLACMERLETVSSIGGTGSQLQAFMKHPV